MTLRPAVLLSIAALLAVAGCGGAKTEADNRNAAGEVLPGSASDAMLPVDTVRSHPPLAPLSATSKVDRAALVKGDAAAAAAAGPASAASAAAQAETPAATPSGE